MEKEKVKVFEIEKEKIFFNINTERFEVGEGREFSSLREARSFILKEKEQSFEGEFLVMDGWDGIAKFTAKKKIYDDYDKNYVIIGDKIDKYGSKKRETFKENMLYPVTKANLDLLEKARKMDRDGWTLINQAKQVKLIK